MPLNYVSVILDLTDGEGNLVTFGSAQFVPSAILTDVPDGVIITQQPVQVPFTSGGSPSARLLATDNPSPAPSGWTWGASFNIGGGITPYNFFLPAGPASFTATNASPAVFTWTPTAAFTAAGLGTLPNGTGVQLSGGSLPTGFSAGTTYYVVASSGSTFQLAATPGGSPLASTSTGSGNVTVTQYNLSSLTPTGTVGVSSPFMLVPSGTASAGEFPVATGTGNGTRWYPAILHAPAPSGDTTGATDGPAVQALINALNTLGGGKVQLQPGTYWGSLTLKSNVRMEGAERLATIWKLPNGANTDVIQGASFSTLTLGGTTGGISGWALRNMTIDGNKANQSGTSYGVRVYGYDFEIACVIIRNCLTDGLYTEWSGNSGGVTDGMEGHYREVKIHDCGGNGWHDRGPHDSRSWDVTIWNTSSAAIGYWAESSNPTTVAAGSNGVDISTFTAGAPGTLNTATTLDFPSASVSATQGAISVTTALGAVTVTYTGTTATSFTGCVAQGASSGSTVSTGAAVAMAGNGFGAVGNLHTQMHVYGGSLYDYVLDTQIHLVDCIGEDTAANGAMVLLRFGNCMLTGGLYIVYSGLPKTSCGIQIGDAVNGASGGRLDTTLGGFGGTSAATAALNIVNDGGFNSIDLLVIQSSGTAFFGSPQRSSRVRIHSAGSGSTATDAANSLIQEYGPVARYVPSTAQQAWTLSPSSAPLNPAVNYRPPSNRFEFGNGITTRWFTDNLSTPSLDISAANGHIVPRSGTSNSLTPGVVNGANGTGTPTISANASDTAGTITVTVNGAPSAGSLIQLNFKNAFTNHPIVIITPANAAAAAIQAYVTTLGGNFIVSAAAAPPASAVLSWNYMVLGQDA